jgi:ABC-type sugar transport system ATPase subunit
VISDYGYSPLEDRAKKLWGYSVMSDNVSVTDQSRGLDVTGKGLSKAFFGIPVLRDVSIQFLAGEVHSILGENGAGKSTLLKILSGIYTPDSGSILLGNEPVQFNSPHAALQRGIYLVPQEPALMPHMSVAENIFLGITPTHGRIIQVIDWKRIRDEAKNILEQLELNIDVDTPANYLSIAQQQLIECARALAHHCRIVFFDEPTSPLTRHEVEILFRVINNMRERGNVLGFISHRMDEVLEISDRLSVMRDGTLISTIYQAAAQKDQLVEQMIGRPLVTISRREQFYATEETVLDAQALTSEPNFRNINFSVKRGEILGFGGLVGSGRTEIAEAIFGVRPKDNGTVKILKQDITNTSTSKIIESGLIYLPEDRAKHGAFVRMSVNNNISSGDLDRIKGKGLGSVLLDLTEERKMANDTIHRMKVKTRSIDAPIKSLSGGNQQKAIFGKWLLTQPQVAILDEPTRGVDAGAKEEIYQVIESMAQEGLAVVVISSELGELIRLCDRVLAVYEGELVGELRGAELTMGNLGKMILADPRQATEEEEKEEATKGVGTP